MAQAATKKKPRLGKDAFLEALSGGPFDFLNNTLDLWRQGPYPDPQTRGQQTLQSLSGENLLGPPIFQPNSWKLNPSPLMGKVTKGLEDWWNSPTDAAAAAQAGVPPEQDPNLILAGLMGDSGGDSSVIDLGKAPGAPRIPKPPVLPMPDFAKARAATEAAKPGDLAVPDYTQSDALFAAGKPEGMSPEEYAKLKKGSVLSGIAKGFFQAPSNAGLGQQILAAGIGALGGMGDYSSQEAELSRKDKEAQRQYSLQGAQRTETRAETLANIENQQNLQRRTWENMVAGQEYNIALANAQVQQDNAKMQWDASIEQVKLDAQNLRDNQTRFLGQTKGGFLMEETGPDGNRRVTVHQLGDEIEAAGLVPTDTDEGKSTYLGMLSPGVSKIKGLVYLLRQDGAEDAVFGDAYKKVLENTQSVGLDNTQFGTAGEKTGLAQKLARQNFDLANILLHDPGAMQRAIATIRQLHPGIRVGR